MYIDPNNKSQEWVDESKFDLKLKEPFSENKIYQSPIISSYFFLSCKIWIFEIEICLDNFYINKIITLSW